MPHPTPNTICLLDDDPSVLCGVGRLLNSAGWHTEKFDDPKKFLCYAKTHRIPVAVIDIWMPLMSGLEVQAELQTLSPSTRVIMFTAKQDPLLRSTALAEGATAFFTKPFDDEEFLTAVGLALSGA